MRNLTIYLTQEASDALEWLQSTGDIPQGWLSQRMQEAIIKEYKKQTKDL